MPFYEFQCKKCKKEYSELLSMNNSKGKGVKCPYCKSNGKKRLMSEFAVTFTNPRGTSKGDSFSYVAGYNLEQAQEERRRAQSGSHMGTDPYPMLDDANRFGEGLTEISDETPIALS